MTTTMGPSVSKALTLKYKQTKHVTYVHNIYKKNRRTEKSIYNENKQVGTERVCWAKVGVQQFYVRF